jgi:hypothetical protein
MANEVDNLHDLQAHSKPGMKKFCLIETAEEGVKGGHCKMSHCELTTWAKYIMSPTDGCNNKKLTMGLRHMAWQPRLACQT